MFWSRRQPPAEAKTKPNWQALATELWLEHETLKYKLTVIDHLDLLPPDDRDAMRARAERLMREKANKFLEMS